MPSTIPTQCTYLIEYGASAGTQCDYDAEFEVCTANGGPNPHLDITQACRFHVGLLLGHQPDCSNPEGVFWQVYPIN